MQWTAEQQQAIESQGGSLLVSAAAGSGKTAVLVARVLRWLSDEKKPCAANELLIVTFTRLAAAEMRQRIRKALGELLAAQPENALLRRQQQLLPLAQICTIDSFCLRLVKEHFAALELPPELRLLSESEQTLWKAEAAEETLEEAYRRGTESFARLGLLLELGGDDAVFKKMLLQCADFANADPDPQAWLQRAAAAYGEGDPPQASIWGKLLLARVREGLGFARQMALQTAAELAAEEPLAKAYLPAVQSDLAALEALKALVDQGHWDALRRAFAALRYAALGRRPKGCESMLAAQCKAKRALWKKELAQLSALLCVSEAEHEEDMRTLAPLAEEFTALVQDFLERFAARKRRQKAADFNDLLHWSLRLLLTEQGEKTPLAKEISGQFREILVDEYQDVNLAQGKLFQALSREESNLFLVGDVKQSIYRFRQANPEQFLQKRRDYFPYDGRRYPACLILGRNFRSRPGVTQTVNFVFRQLMRQEAAEIDYSAQEELICGVEHPAAQRPDAQLHLLETGQANAAQALEREAAYVARYIAGCLAHGEQISDQGRLRTLRPRDFAILLRSDKSAGLVFAQALKAQGVAAHTARMESLFQSREIQFLLSLLRAVDNPLLDVPMLALLLSPVFGFSPAKLARLRAAEPSAPSIFHCLRTAALQGDRACAAFLEKLGEYRAHSAVLPPGDLIRFLLEDSGMLALVGAMPQPGRRKANLQRLEDQAVSYAENAGASLSGFLRYLEQIEKNETLLTVSDISESADVVRIMSIHKSKGLEFPVCILAQCGRGFNERDSRNPLLLHGQLGLGLQRPEPEARVKLATLPHEAVKNAQLHAAKSEELRLLYVAMTRARDRLVLVLSGKELEGRLRKAALRVAGAGAHLAQSMQSAKSYADWLLLALLRHPDAHALRAAAEMESNCTLPCGAEMEFFFETPEAPQAAESAARQPGTAAADAQLLAEIHRRLDYRYPYEALSFLAAKRGVSELTEGAQREKYAFSSQPAFLRQGGLTAAQKGSAMHSFLQFADYAAAARDLEAEIMRLCGEGFLSKKEADALDRGKLSVFFKGEFARRMLASPRLLREKKFTLRLPAAEFTQGKEIPGAVLEGEEIVVQGIVDCAFEEAGKLVLLDYKTDRVESLEALKERYARQLRMYAKAMERCFGMPVSQLLIYSF
ncbi:MAG: helicase-exonuclease AddAB subunit AddA, partial [Oscillospiraceae bacterium]|nr:helicase-exonuclease AddAB subunit AddA [Oscillospiraceae bacterium]